jgi:hypothetical protein
MRFPQQHGVRAQLIGWLSSRKATTTRHAKVPHDDQAVGGARCQSMSSAGRWSGHAGEGTSLATNVFDSYA